MYRHFTMILGAIFCRRIVVLCAVVSALISPTLRAYADHAFHGEGQSGNIATTGLSSSVGLIPFVFRTNGPQIDTGTLVRLQGGHNYAATGLFLRESHDGIARGYMFGCTDTTGCFGIIAAENGRVLRFGVNQGFSQGRFNGATAHIRFEEGFMLETDQVTFIFFSPGPSSQHAIKTVDVDDEHSIEDAAHVAYYSKNQTNNSGGAYHVIFPNRSLIDNSNIVVNYTIATEFKHPSGSDVHHQLITSREICAIFDTGPAGCPDP